MLYGNMCRLAQAVMEKQAAGRMMGVRYSNLVASGEVRDRKGVVFMPDCPSYRKILTDGSAEEKAALVRKFVLNLPKDTKFITCNASIVTK